MFEGVLGVSGKGQKSTGGGEEPPENEKLEEASGAKVPGSKVSSQGKKYAESVSVNGEVLEEGKVFFVRGSELVFRVGSREFQVHVEGSSGASVSAGADGSTRDGMTRGEFLAMGK